MDIFAVRVAITHYETAWQVAEQKGWPEDVSGADRQALYAGLGRAYELAEAWPQARDTYQAMIAYAQTIGATAMECLGLNRLATVYINGFKERQQAIALLEQARAVAEQNRDRPGLAETEWNLSLAAIHEQKTSLARQHGELALAIVRQLGHPQLLARCLNSLSMVYTQLRRWDMVEVYANEARHPYAATGNRVLAADSQRMIGMSQMFSGRPWDSLATLQEMFAFSQQIENLWGEADCAWKLALIRVELGHYGQDETLLPVGLTGWYETEALLRGGTGDLARAEVERLAGIVGDNQRYRLPLLRSQAVMAQWDGDPDQAITHLETALTLAQEIGLPGEEWSILGALGRMYADKGDPVKAQQSYKDSAAIILRLAETIDEEDLRAGFLSAGPVRSILEICKVV